MISKDLNTKILWAIVAFWLIFSFWYVANDKISEYKNVQLRNAIVSGQQAGKEATIRALITRASECKLVPVSDGQQTIQLLNVACLQQRGQAEAVETNQEEQPAV